MFAICLEYGNVKGTLVPSSVINDDCDILLFRRYDGIFILAMQVR